MIRYQQEVNIPDYARRINVILDELKQEYRYNEQKTMSVLKDILYQTWKKTKPLSARPSEQESSPNKTAFQKWVPVASTVKEAVPPLATVASTGCLVIEGRYMKTLVNRGFYKKKPDTSFDTICTPRQLFVKRCGNR